MLSAQNPGYPAPDAASRPGSLPVVLAAARYVVIDKPAGLLSVPGKGPGKQDCAAARVRAMFPAATGPLVVHRLDMETSGLMVFALDESAQRELSRQFERRTVVKAYTALVAGLVGPDSGAIDLPLRPDLARRPIQVADPVLGRPAVTRWAVLGREIDRTRLRLVPVTGRTHQLRVHCADPRGLGHAIIGDTLYGACDDAGHRSVDAAGPGPRLMLHARELSFIEPGGRRRIDTASPAPF